MNNNRKKNPYQSKASSGVKYTVENFLVCMTSQDVKGTQISLYILYEQKRHIHTLEL